MAERIAFLGIGLMGAPMATNLLAAGLPLVLWNRTPAKAEALRPLGCQRDHDTVDALKPADRLLLHPGQELLPGHGNLRLVNLRARHGGTCKSIVPEIASGKGRSTACLQRMAL